MFSLPLRSKWLKIMTYRNQQVGASHGVTSPKCSEAGHCSSGQSSTKSEINILTLKWHGVAKADFVQ